MAPDAFVRSDDQWSLRGLPAVFLENRFLRVVICPARGARVPHFEHRVSGTDRLWHNPRIEHRPVPIGSSDDDSVTATAEKWIPLHADTPQQHVRHRTTSHGPRGLDFRWKLQPARAIEAGESLQCSVRAVLFEGREPLRGFTDDGKALR